MTQQPYTQSFFATQSEWSAEAAAIVVPQVLQLVPAQSVLDVGCGVGTWLAAFEDAGVEDYVGVDGDYVQSDQLRIPADRFLAHDLTTPLALDRRFDLVVSLEVGEHLPPEAADTFVETLTGHADAVLFSAAIPGQGGTHHVNEQWPSYWAALFADRGFDLFDVMRPRLWEDSRVVGHYRQNIVLFARGQAGRRLERERKASVHRAPTDVVHPAHLEFVERYRVNRVLSLRELAQQFPHSASVAVKKRLPAATRAAAQPVRRIARAAAGRKPGEILAWRFGRMLAASAPDAIRPAVLDGGAEVLVPIADPGYRRLFLNGRYEDDVQELVRHVLRPGDLAVDVGANFGAHTILFAALVGSRGRVTAFEPNPAVADWLERSVALNGWQGRVAVDRRAVGDRTGQIELYVDDEAGLKSATSPHRWLEGGKVREVGVTTLDDALSGGARRIRLLKIDIEGAEVTALSGAQQLLAESPPEYVLVEFASFNDGLELRGLLEQAGYRAVRLDGGRLDPYFPEIPVQSDAAPGRGEGFTFVNVLFRYATTRRLDVRSSMEQKSFAEAWNTAQIATGWLTEAQGETLYEHAAQVPDDRAIVEIGSHQGLSTIVLGQAKQPDVDLIAVDPWDDPTWGGGEVSYDRFVENVHRAGVSVEPVRALSTEAAEEWDRGEAVGLLFIDGAHDLPTVLADIDKWGAHVADDGVVSIHDAFSSTGVTAAVLRRFAFRRNHRYLGAAGSLVSFRRERVSGTRAAVDGARLVSRLPWFARNVAVKVFRRRGWGLPQRLLGHRTSHNPI